MAEIEELKPGTVLLKPKLKGDDIQIKIDSKSSNAMDFLNIMGPKMPVIKIGDYVLNVGELVSFEMSVSLNSFPTFTMTIDDSLYNIREALKEDIDKCTIFVGYKTWYIKYNGIINKNTSSIGGTKVYLEGMLMDEFWYETIQKLYLIEDYPKFKDILLELCKQMKLGLYIVTTPDLEKGWDFIINPNMTLIDFFQYIISKFTVDNFWCLDFQYYMFVSNFEKLRALPVDLYSINRDGTGLQPVPKKPIIFTSNPFPEKLNINDMTDLDKEMTDKISIDYYTIRNNYTEVAFGTYNTYYQNETEQPSRTLNGKVCELKGKSEKYFNTFERFEKYKFPYYYERINKEISGNSISLTTKNIIWELTPMGMVELEIFLPPRGDLPHRLDAEHSGKYIVIGYSYEFNKAKRGEELPSIIQKIELRK